MFRKSLRRNLVVQHNFAPCFFVYVGSVYVCLSVFLCLSVSVCVIYVGSMCTLYVLRVRVCVYVCMCV